MGRGQNYDSLPPDAAASPLGPRPAPRLRPLPQPRSQLPAASSPPPSASADGQSDDAFSTITINAVVATGCDTRGGHGARTSLHPPNSVHTRQQFRQLLHLNRALILLLPADASAYRSGCNTYRTSLPKASRLHQRDEKQCHSCSPVHNSSIPKRPRNFLN